MDDSIKAWISSHVGLAAHGISERGILDEALVEARAEWALPNRLLVGKVRSTMNPREFYWFICGEVRLDYLPGDVATSPREALRHFSMKWHLDAERTDGAEQAQALVEQAESIYALADDERAWQA